MSVSVCLYVCVHEHNYFSTSSLCQFFVFVTYGHGLPSVLWRCWLGGRKGIRSVKNWWGAGVVICLERGADLHMVQLMLLPLTVSCLSNLIQIGFTFLVPGSPGQRAVNRVCVCVCTSRIGLFAHRKSHRWRGDPSTSTTQSIIVPKAMAGFSSGGVVIRFILSVLWMTTLFRVTARNRRCEKGVYSKWLNRWQYNLPLQLILKLTHQGQHLTGGGVWYLRLTCFECYQCFDTVGWASGRASAL